MIGVLIIIGGVFLISTILVAIGLHNAPSGEEIPGVGFVQTDGKK